MKTKMFVVKVKNCISCPNVKTERTPGAGCATDYYCGLTKTKIAGYVEWPREGPQDGIFPDFCPLKNGKQVKE